MDKKQKIQRTVIIYPGRFQPFGKHHAATFLWITNNFPHADPFIATSNVTNEKSPFNFNEKKAIISAYGFAGKVKRVTDPYKAIEILNKYDPKTTAVIFVVGKKDAQRLSGKGKYFLEYPDPKFHYHPSDIQNKLKPFSENGYVLIAPHIKLKVPKYGEMSGTSIRQVLGNPPKNVEERKKLFNSIFGWYSDKLATMIFNKLKTIKEDKIPGGLADNKDVIDLIRKYGGKNQDTIEAELIKGVKVEMEHTSDHNIALEIAIDHLWEDLHYYTKLATLNLEENKLFTADWWKDTINEGLVDHSETELRKAGLFDADSDYNGMIGTAVLELMKTFASQGHSGFSAGWVSELFSKLSKYETLTPLTEDESEWMDVREMGMDTNVTLFQSKRNPAAFATNPKDKSTWYHVDGKKLLEYLNTNSHLYTSNKKLLNEGGAAGHMAHVFDLPQVKTGPDLLKVFVETAKSLQANPASVKIDGVNTTLKIVKKNGKTQFALDRGSMNPLDVAGITIDDLGKRFSPGHGMLKLGREVLKAFNAALPKITTELQKLGMLKDPNILLNIETVIGNESGKTNVISYKDNFFVVHGTLKSEMATEKRRKQTEISGNTNTINALAEKASPIMKKMGYGIYGVIPTKPNGKVSFTEAINTPVTIQFNKTKKVSKPLKDWLAKAVNPRNTKIKFNNGTLDTAMTRKNYIGITSQKLFIDDLTTNPKDQKILIDGAIIYHATRLLGNAILDKLGSDVGEVAKHEGIVIRDSKISPTPFKITGEFIVSGLQSTFGT